MSDSYRDAPYPELKKTHTMALDWSSVTVGRFLASRYEGRAETARVETGLALAVVDEWRPW